MGVKGNAFMSYTIYLCIVGNENLLGPVDLLTMIPDH